MRRVQALEEQPRVATGTAGKGKDEGDVSDMEFDDILDSALKDESQAVFVNILLEGGVASNNASVVGRADGPKQGVGKRQALEQRLQSQAKRTRRAKPKGPQQSK